MADKTVVVRAVYRSNVAQGLRQDAGAITSLSASVESAGGKVVNRTKALGAASAVAGKLLVIGVGGAMAVSAKAAIDFESSMAGVAKTTDLAGNSFDRNSGPLFQFGEALRSLALRTPVNVNDLAQIAALGGQLGIEVPNLVKFTEVMAALAVSTNLTAEEAATGFARFANIMRTPEDEFERLGSIVVELGNNMATTESEILRFGTRIAPIGTTVGATEEEVFALSAALTSLGVPAERGGTAIQKWMILAKQAADQGGASLEQFAVVAGMTAEEFGRLFQESPGRAFEAFAKGLDRINTSGGDVFGTLKGLELAEVRTTQVLLAAASGVDVLTESLDLASEAGEENTALFEEAARRYGTTESAIKLVANAFTDLRIEIGNMILGTGGLAFSIDMLREFFGIVKDNLPFLSKFVLVIGVLLALKAGFWFADLAQKAILATKNLLGVGQAATAVSTGARIVQSSLTVLTLGMQAALGIAGALAAVWMIQAANAAELKAEIKGLQEQIDGGADAFDVFHEAVVESLSTEQIARLNEMGISTQDLTQYLMDGKDAASGVGQAIAAIQNPDMNAEDFEFKQAARDAKNLEDAIASADAKVSGFMEVKRGELRNALIESGQAADLTVEKMEELADRAIEIFGFDVTNEEFVRSVHGFLTQASQDFKGFRSGVRGIPEEINKAGSKVNWASFLPPDAREDIVEDFFEDNIKAADEFAKAMEEAFSDVGDVVRGGMPVWEEYEKAVFGGDEGLPTFKEVLRAQEQFLDDTRDWIERMPDIMEMGATADTVGWIDSLDTPIRGAIGRLNDAQLQELIDGANRNFDELQKLHTLRWLQIYPDTASVAFGAMVGELANQVTDMNLPGEAAGDAFTQGLMDIMAALPEENKAAFQQYLSGLFQDEQWFQDQGFGSFEEIKAGMLLSIAGWPTALRGAVIRAIMEGVQQPIDDSFQIKSPSKWAFGRGESILQGFQKGMESETTKLARMMNPDHFFPTMNSGSGAMSTINNSRVNNYSLTVNGGGRANNINAEAQTLLTLLTIVGGVESGAGR